MRYTSSTQRAAWATLDAATTVLVPSGSTKVEVGPSLPSPIQRVP
jgi:hypothetical protein